MVLSSMYKSLGLILCAMKRKGKEDEKEGGDGGREEEEEERKKTEGSERGLNELRIRDTQMKITLTIISLCKVHRVGECGEQACSWDAAGSKYQLGPGWYYPTNASICTIILKFPLLRGSLQVQNHA